MNDKHGDEPTRQPAALHTWDGPAIFRTTQLTFDPGDKANGSLYLCDPSGGKQAQTVDLAIAALRQGSLWSSQDPKQVRDDQRQAYEDQLEFVEAVAVTVGGAGLVLARCNHPKFPSSAERFAGWKRVLGVAVT